MTTKTEKPADNDQQGLDALVQRYDLQAKNWSYNLILAQREKERLERDLADANRRIREAEDAIRQSEGMVAAVQTVKSQAGKTGHGQNKG